MRSGLLVARYDLDGLPVTELLFPGDVVAEGVFGGVAPDVLSATVLTNVVLLDAEVTHGLLDEGGPTSRWLVRRMTVRVRRAENRQSNLMMADTRTRLARLLLDWCEISTSVHVPGPFRGGVSQAGLAEVIGSTRHTVNRTLQDFERRGVVVLEHGGVTVENFDVMRRCARRAQPYLHGVDRSATVAAAS